MHAISTTRANINYPSIYLYKYIKINSRARRYTGAQARRDDCGFSHLGEMKHFLALVTRQSAAAISATQNVTNSAEMEK